MLYGRYRVVFVIWLAFCALVIFRMWPKPVDPAFTIQRAWSHGKFEWVEVVAFHVHCVRWYPDSPDWCIIHVGHSPEQQYCVDKPGKEVWDDIFRGDRKHTLRYPVRNNNVDPKAAVGHPLHKDSQ